MPYYEYQCAQCGAFDRRRPLSESQQPAECPTCGQTSPRKLSAPSLGSGASPSQGTASGNSHGGCGSGSCGHVH